MCSRAGARAKGREREREREPGVASGSESASKSGRSERGVSAQFKCPGQVVYCLRWSMKKELKYLERLQETRDAEL